MALTTEKTQGLVFGTFKEAKAMIGAVEVKASEVDVNWAMIKVFGSLVQDGNPSYWDGAFAREVWGEVIAPPGLLRTWVLDLEWQPDRESEPPFVWRIPLPGTTLVSSTLDTEFCRPVRLGDRLVVTEQLLDISPEKRTSLGLGHFVDTLMIYRDQAGDVVAQTKYSILRFTPETPVVTG